jgi:hypothetical protein
VTCAAGRAVRARPSLVVVAPRALDVLPLLRAGIAPGQLVTGEAGLEAVAFARAGSTVWTADVDAHRCWSSRTLVHLLPLLERALAAAASPASVLPYANSPALAARVAAASAALLPAGARAVPLLEEKAEMRQVLARAGLPVPDHRVVPTEGSEVDELLCDLGAPLVVQSSLGSSGMSTWRVDDGQRWHALVRRLPPQQLLVSRWSDGLVLNLHVLVEAGRTVVSAPSVQLSGLDALGVPWPVYAGNDFGAAAALPAGHRDTAHVLAHRVGSVLSKLGHRGVAGVDLLLAEDGTAQVLEVNARAQGSTWLLGESEAAQGAPPLLARVVQEACGDLRAARVAAGAQLLLRHPGPLQPVALSPTLRPGRHACVDGVLHWLDDAAGLAGVAVGECVISGLPPQPGLPVAPGAVLARLATWEQVVEGDGRTVTDRGSELARALWDVLRVTPG